MSGAAIVAGVEVASVAIDVISEVSKDPKVQEINQLLHDWFVEHIHNSPVSRNTEAVNHVRIALGALRDSLVPVVKE